MKKKFMISISINNHLASSSIHTFNLFISDLISSTYLLSIHFYQLIHVIYMDKRVCTITIYNAKASGKAKSFSHSYTYMKSVLFPRL